MSIVNTTMRMRQHVTDINVKLQEYDLTGAQRVALRNERDLLVATLERTDPDIETMQENC